MRKYRVTLEDEINRFPVRYLDDRSVVMATCNDGLASKIPLLVAAKGGEITVISYVMIRPLLLLLLLLRFQLNNF